MARRVRMHDWGATPLGPIERWSPTQRAIVDLVLASGHAAQLAWGRERIFLYNDAHAPMLGGRHPSALGMSFRHAWPDIWKDLEPLVERAFAGETVRLDDLHLVMTGNGHAEDTWWSLSCSPVRDERGAVIAVLNVTVDATAKHRDDARLRALIKAGGSTLYRMSADWRTMFQLDSDRLSNTTAPTENWLDQYIPEEDVPAVRDAVEKAIRSKSLFELEHRVRQADGSIGWVLSRAVPMLGADGQITEWFGAGSDVTTRKIAIETMRESEERLALAIRIGELASWDWNVRTGEVKWNDRHFLLQGYGVGEVIPSFGAWLARVHPEDRQETVALIARARDRHETYAHEFRSVHGDGSIHWCAARGHFFYGADGAALRMIGVMEDITERKGIETALRASEERHAFLLKLSDATRSLTDPMDVQCAAMKVVGEHLRVDRVQYVEVSAEDYIIHDDYVAPGFAKMVGRYPISLFGAPIDAYRRGEAIVFSDIHSKTDVSEDERQNYLAIQCIAAVGVPLLKAGQLVSVLVVHQGHPREWTAIEIDLMRETATRTWDALERARAEAALRESEQRQTFLLAFGDALRSLTQESDILRTAARLLAEYLAADRSFFGELFPAQDLAIMHPDFARANLPSLAGRFRCSDFRETVQALSKGKPYVVNDVARSERLSEQTRAEYLALGYASFFSVPLFKYGALSLNLSVVSSERREWTDAEVQLTREIAERTWTVVERVRAETALQAHREELLEAATLGQRQAEEASRAKDEFLAILSHELRTPLTAILLWSAALRAGHVSQEELPRALDAIKLSAEAQSRLIENLLDLSRLQFGKVQLERRSTRVRDILDAVVEMIRPTADGLTFALDVSGADDPTSLDPGRMQQVLWNLLTNAVKFTPRGGRIDLRARKDEGQLVLEVEDTGQGIAPDFLPHVFQRFRQADMREERAHGGLGIGLALCRHLVELHGGTIEARSQGVGAGARFIVRVPWIDAPAAAPAAAERRTGASPLRAGLTVLLVEDDPQTREAMQWNLERAGAKVLAVASAPEALAVHEHAHGDGAPSLLICDIGLPGMSGYELIRSLTALRRASGQKPVVACAVSAHARKEDRLRAIDAGFDVYVTKPVSPERLIEVVEELADVAAGITRDDVPSPASHRFAARTDA